MHNIKYNDLQIDIRVDDHVCSQKYKGHIRNYLIKRIFVNRNRKIMMPPQFSHSFHYLTALVVRLQGCSQRVVKARNFGLYPTLQDNSITHLNFVLECAPSNPFLWLSPLLFGLVANFFLYSLTKSKV